jgi:DNA-binding LacI/PurR family transcriptional regulator
MPSQPRYEKLKQLLKDKIAEGGMKAGDRFPSQNELMRRYKLSYSTVTRALNELEGEGYLRREQGRGTFVAEAPGGEPRAVQPRCVAAFIQWDARSPVHMSFRRIYAAIEASLPTSWQLRLVPYDPDMSRLEQFLFSREVNDGAIFVYPQDEHFGFVKRVAQEMPAAVIGSPPRGGDISYVHTDNQAAAEKAVLWLLDRNHREIGIISGALEMTDSRERLEGYRSALRQRGVPFRESLVVFTHPAELNGYGALLELFDRNTTRRITAVFAAGDLLAMGALAAAKSMGLRVPADLSVMGLDDIEDAARFDPPLTTVRVPIEELARRATGMLVAQMGHREPAQVLEIPGEMVERASAGPAPAK